MPLYWLSATIIIALFQWAFLIEAKQNLSQYQTVCTEIVAQANGVSRSNIATGLALSNAQILTNLQQAILSLPMYSAGTQTVIDGQEGESVLDHHN